MVIPAFREARTIRGTVERLREELDPRGGVEIIVVDDASPDETLSVAKQAGADRVLALPAHRGKGAAVRAGMLAAQGEARVFTDADLAYSPAQVERVAKEVEAGWEVVIGSRRHVEAITLVRAGRMRELSGRLFNFVTRMRLLDSRLDTQCGLKGFQAQVAQVVFGRSRIDGFAFDVEVLYLAERCGFTLREVPVELTGSSASTVHLLRDAPLMLWDLFRIRRWAASGVYDVDPRKQVGHRS